MMERSTLGAFVVRPVPAYGGLCATSFSECVKYATPVGQRQLTVSRPDTDARSGTWKIT